ncbi:MAG: CARDB domain-containing protein [Caldilineaceae bacterium]
MAATDHEDLYANFSNYGPDWVDLAAPGVDTYSTVPSGNCAMCDSSGYNLASGTSMATPHVTGAVALVLSKYKDLTNEQVKQRLLSGADKLPDQPKKTLTNGRLNLLNAMEDDQTPPAAVTNLTITGLLMTKMELSWTATGDDGAEGQANGYDLRYSLTPITEANWAQAFQVENEPKPQEPGALETITVGGLQPGVNYYFAIRVADNAGNLSELSNIASASTSKGAVVFQDDMESGPGNWDVSEEGALWHLSNLRSNSPSNAWYYGQDDKRNYDTGESNAGFLTSPEITLAEADEALVIFSEWSQVQENLRFDRTRVQVSTDGNSWKTVFESHGTADKWEQRTISLGDDIDLSGGSLQVRFWFDTVNDRFNEFEGWYVDDVQIIAARMEKPGQQFEAPNLVLREGNIGFNPPNPTQGDNVTIHAVVLNTGAAESGPVVVQFADVTDGAPIPIGQPQTIAGIPVGGSGAAQVTYESIPLGHSSEDGPTERDIQVIVDPFNFISEVSESDNSATRVLPVLPLNAPNLKITPDNIGFDPPAPDPGDQVTINATVLNTGPVEASDVVVQFMDVTRNGSQPIGQQQTIDAIPAGGSVLVQVTYDTTGLTGDRDIQVVIDPVNSVIESDESDNDAKARLSMATQAAANLIVLKDNIGFAPASPTEGDTVTIYATILNDGGVEATDVLVQFVDTTDNGSTPIGQQQTIESIPAGGSGMVQVTYETSGKAGDRKIDVEVDPHNFIPESRETDNTAKQTLTVASPPAPNLSIQSSNIGFNPVAPVQGDNVTIHATILNNGALEANDVAVQFVDVTNGDSVPIGGRLTIASIGAGSSGAVETTYDTTNRPGDRRIQVVVDPGNFIMEADETDNVARELLRVASPPAPNLVALASNIEFQPANPTDQDTVVIHAVILNTGSQEARNVLVQFIDLTYGVAVPISKEQFIDVIPAGGSATAEATYDAGGPVRGRKIQVLVDSNNLIRETNESDNEAIKTLAVTASAAPNLAVPPVTIGFAPRHPTRGDEITISAVIINNGAADAENVLVQFTDVTSGRAVPIGEQQIIDLIPTGGNGIASVKLDSSGLGGERKIRVIVDPNNFISESDETDNKGDQTVSIASPAAPNLVAQPSNITFAPPSPTEGQPVSVTVTVLNDGGEDAEAVLVQFVDVTDGGMIPVGEKQTIDLIPAGGSATAKVTYQTAGKAGDRKIQVLVDPHTIIAESNEKDNDATQSLMVAPAAAPNLVVEDANISFSPAFPVQGETVTLHVTVINNGSADATDVSVQFVDVTNGADIPIGSSQNIDAIAAGASATAEISYDTSGKQGERKIQVVVDRNNLIPETNENDNDGTQVLTVISSPAPNLVMQANNIGFNPPQPGEGDQVTINAAILNTGSADANDVMVQFVDVTTSNSAPIGQPQTIENIPAGGSGSTQITYDTTGMVGDRKIQVVVDPNNFIQEAKETDNQAQKTLEMAPLAAPNLVAKEANVSFTPSDAKTFDDVTITIAVINDGTAEANDVGVRFFDVTGENPAPIGQPQTIENIPVGGSGAASVSYSTGGAVGERKIRIVVDPNNFINELKETDNEIKAITLKVTAHLGPNLVMLPGNIGLNPPSPIDGDQVVLHAVVINNGASGVRDVDVQFIDVTGGGIEPIGAPQSITTIPAGSSGAAEVTFDTEGRVGERKVRVVVDPNNFINEVNEEDNEANTSFTVSPPPANLSILPGNIKFDPAEPETGAR